MGFVKNIPVVGSLIAGPEKPQFGSRDLPITAYDPNNMPLGPRDFPFGRPSVLTSEEKQSSSTPASQPDSEIAKTEQPTLLQADPGNPVAKQRKRRTAAAQQSGVTILGTGTEGLGGSHTPGG